MGVGTNAPCGASFALDLSAGPGDTPLDLPGIDPNGHGLGFALMARE